MIDLGLSFDEMKVRIGFIHYVFDEFISPLDNPDFFISSCLGDSDYLLDLRKFNAISGGFYSKLNLERKTVFGEMQYNSFMHGNGFNPELPVHVGVAEGREGYAVQIEDCGRGFDILEKIKSFDLGDRYFIHGGVGLEEVIRVPEDVAVVSYNSKGNIVNIMYLGGFV